MLHRFISSWMAVACLAIPSASLLAQHKDPYGRTLGGALPLNRVAIHRTAPLNHAAIRTEDAQREAAGLPMRYAMPFPVELHPGNSGTLEFFGNMALWRLRIECPNSYHINLGFKDFKLPFDSEMRVYSADYSHIVRPFTGKDHNPDGQFWTPVVAGDEMVLELWFPAALRAKLRTTLTQIGAGYRFFGAPAYGASGSGSCNVNVACPQGVGWEPEIASVGAVSHGGSAFCSGAMVNNTSNDGTPYFLTAAHCSVNPSSLVVYWNYEESSCGASGTGSFSQFSSGATLRATYSPSDFTLVEFNSAPPGSYNVSFAGWDRTGADATSATAIHHPSGDAKKISFENDATTTTSYSGSSVPGDGTHVRVIDWDTGTTEGGSSGSPLFDQNHRVIGQLHGGGAACGNNLSDWYGKLSVSWNGGGSSSSRLSDWLDAAGTGFTTVDTDGGGGGPTGPANDDCANAIAIGDGVNGPYSSANATTSSPVWGCAQGGGDVWFSYQAPCTGTATINTCSGAATFDTAIEAFSGTCGSLTQIACNDDTCSLQSEVTISTVFGETYLIRVGGYQGATGTFDLTVSCSGTVPTTDDECAGATVVVDGVNGPFSTASATLSTPAWTCAGGGAADRWYAYTATCNGDVAVDLCSATRSYDTAMEVFSGSCGALTLIECNDDSCGLGSAVTFTGTVGTTYYIRVGGFNGNTGSFDVTISCTTAGGTATATAYGSGCYDRARSFYEAPANGAFDLDNSTLTLTPNADGGYDVTSGGAAWFTPVSANLGLSDDGTSNHALPFTLNYPGGSTNQITLCSNGYVWLDGSTDGDWNPTVGELMSESGRLAPMWDDYDPTSGGTVHYDVQGSTVYISWVGVPEYNQANSSTFQCCISSSGVIEYRYQTVSNDAGDTVIGFSQGGGARQPAETDLSGLGTLSTSGPDSAPLTMDATTRPVIGTTQTMTISNIPGSTITGAVMYGLTQYAPGLDLTVIGMGGCELHSSSVFTIAFAGSPTSTADWAIANDGSLIGVNVYTTAATITPGANALGVLTSNGVHLVLDVL